MGEIVIASACRTAIGTFGGTLKDVPAAELGAIVVKEAVKRAGSACYRGHGYRSVHPRYGSLSVHLRMVRL